MKTARVRVRRWKPKGSDLWVVAIHESPGNSNRAFALTRARQVILAAGEDIAGFAIVVWSKDGTSVCDSHAMSGVGHIPNILIPDFVRARLLADRIQTWVQEDL